MFLTQKPGLTTFYHCSDELFYNNKLYSPKSVAHTYTITKNS